jgi:F-type H+-transporting ATPase subunit gamma
METIEALRKKIAVTEDLREVVKTMKTLAAVSIRHYERAVESLRQYSRTVEMGMQIVCAATRRIASNRPAAGGR